jgi:extradiol dioxygenase family protein
LSFHLSIPVPDPARSAEFFTTVLGGTLTHEDPSGYVNVDLFGIQLTLTRGASVAANGFHFGVNVGMAELHAIADRARSCASAHVVSEPTAVDRGTPLERTKMYLRCPAGYLIEVKGFAGRT